jgi:putative transposase
LACAALRSQQDAEWKAIRAEFPDVAAIHSPVVLDALARLDKTSQAFFRRVKAGEKAGLPRYQSRDRWHSFTSKEVGVGARLENGFLVLAKRGGIAMRWSRQLEDAPKTVTLSWEADGWSVCFSCADMSVQPLPATGQETGIDLGLEAFGPCRMAHASSRLGLLSQGRTGVENGLTLCLAAQAGQQP